MRHSQKPPLIAEFRYWVDLAVDSVPSSGRDLHIYWMEFRMSPPPRCPIALAVLLEPFHLYIRRHYEL